MEYEKRSDFRENILVWNFHKLEGFFHVHKSVELNFNLSGELVGIIGNEKYVAKAGEILFVPSLFSHNIHSEGEDARSFSLIIPVSYFKLFEIDYSTLYYDLLTNKEVNQKLIEIALHIKGDGSLSDKGYFAILMGTLMKNYKKTNIKASKDASLMVDIIMYIENHYRENIELDQVADYFHFSRFYFSKLFHKMFQCPFTHYVNTLRLHYIQDHKNEFDDMSELIYEAGFQSLSSYYRVKKTINIDNF